MARSIRRLSGATSAPIRLLGVSRSGASASSSAPRTIGGVVWPARTQISAAAARWRAAGIIDGTPWYSRVTTGPPGRPQGSPLLGSREAHKARAQQPERDGDNAGADCADDVVLDQVTFGVDDADEQEQHHADDQPAG